MLIAQLLDEPPNLPRCPLLVRHPVVMAVPITERTTMISTDACEEQLSELRVPPAIEQCGRCSELHLT